MRSGCLVAVACAVLAPFAGLFLLFAIPSWANDRKLEALGDRLLAYPPPPETFHTDNTAEGSIALRGNGNHCDYQVRISLSTNLSEEAVVRYYAAARIAGVETEPVSLRVYFERDQDGDGLPKSLIVEAYDSTDAGLDLRCH
ncbi:hypothetical protein [Nonomuraea bangladeshensis]|uniref:hypothetical protein n=1 Tax=Nonomuraea bangladeshensis TaxID=404385 RepID=UPI003C2AB034